MKNTSSLRGKSRTPQKSLFKSAEAASGMSDVLKLTSDIRDVALKFYAGFGALIAGFFTIRTYRLSVRTRRSESFIKAIDQIGSEDVLERVGGIYGLGILLRAADPRDDYWRLMDILSAIVRRYAARKDGPSPEYIPLDVEAALNVIGRRRTVIQRDEPDASTDLNSTDLSNAYLVGMRFEWAYFGYAILNGANFRDAYLNAADFNGAEMKQAQLHGANLTEANISQDQVDSASGNRVHKTSKTRQKTHALE
jgi:Pentapeptide repeats (8 copies)